MHTLYVTQEEESLFSKLPDDVREGWGIASEVLTFDDSPAKFRLRLELLRLHNPALLALRDRIKTLPTSRDVAAELVAFDLHLLPHNELLPLLFALGSGILTTVIGTLLSEAVTDADLADLAALTFIRHEILASYQPVSS